MDLFSERQLSEAPRERELLGRRLKERDLFSERQTQPCAGDGKGGVENVLKNRDGRSGGTQLGPC